jgi:hypothetical protein
MLSTLSINANGEVVGGSTKFKLSSNHLFADACNNDQQQQQDQKKATESAKDSLSTSQIDMLKGDLQDLEARSAEYRYLLSAKLKWPF